MNFEKSTDELYNIIENKNTIESYIEENSEELIKMTLSEYLENMLKKYGLSKKEVINRSMINQIYAYQIFSGEKNKPSRDKVIQLIFAMHIDLNDAQKLLYIAGTNKLYPRNKRDSVIIFAINKGYSIDECDDILFELSEKTILKD